jgi:hypothetical protein
MPATAIQFADYGRFSKPKRVYCDSNFAVHVLLYNIVSPAMRSPIQISCEAFYQQLLADSVDTIASLLTYSEVMHAYSFKIKGGMYDLAQGFLRSKGVNRSGPEAFKQLLRFYPVDAGSLWNTLQYRVEAVDDFFSNKIRLLSPLPSPSLTNITKSVADLASILHSYYSTIEAADSLHLSLSTYLAADAIVSLDTGLLAVDNFTIYTN